MKAQIKNKVLKDLADLIIKNSTEIIKANNIDLNNCQISDEALYDRLKVNEDKIRNMQSSILKVMQMDDPVGKVLYNYESDEGLIVENRVVPFGIILIIYESRPDVTIEAAITAFKAGNKILLKGGKESLNTNLILTDLWHQALVENNQDTDCIKYLNYDRNQTQKLIQRKDNQIDIIIPRGGESLINSIRENTTIPMIISGRGNNFLFIDENADFDMAIKIILDGKKRISVCNALDKVFIHKIHGANKLNKLITALTENNIKILADSHIQKINNCIEAIDDNNVYYEEFLSNQILLAQIDDLNSAISAINLYSGGHSAAIVSKDTCHAQVFQERVDCAAVYHNASTRFTDGGEFGLGAEIAISTQKLHFRGPVGLNELVTNKWFISGKGNVRG